MPSITGTAQPGSSLGLRCARCGDPCVDPQGHLAVPYNPTDLLHPDDLVRLYGETIKWGRRWRVMKVLKGGELKSFVDDMGVEDEFKTPVFFIDSLSDDTNFWNTVGECFDIADDRHDAYRNGAKARHRNNRPNAATGAEWAQEYNDKHAQTLLWNKGATFSGPTQTTQRSK